MVTLFIATCLARFSLLKPTTAEIPLKAPSGWTTAQNQGSTVITPGDLPQGKVYTVIVTPLPTKAGTLDEVYEVGKTMVADVGTYSPAMEPKEARSEGGWDYKLTIGTLVKDKSGLLAQVIGMKKGDAGGTVIVLSDSLETLQKYSDPFSQMIRTLGGSAEPPPAPVVAAASGTVDLQYSVPAGWRESKREGVTVIEATKDDFYDKWRWTLVVMPSQPLTGSLRENFMEYWKALITANYDASITPLPLSVRLSDGYVCAFDADGSAKHKATGAKPRVVSVYLIAHGDRFVPILAIQYGYDSQLSKDLDRFIETARIPGSSDAKISLFNKSDLAGDWTEGSASIASYVTSSGTYAGDASIYTGSDFHLHSDGSYKYNFIGLQGSTHIRESQEGTWSFNDQDLVLTEKKETTTYSLLGYGVDGKGGRFLVLGTYAGAKAKLSFANPRGPLQATWYRAK